MVLLTVVALLAVAALPGVPWSSSPVADAATQVVWNVETVAGAGQAGSSGDGGPPLAATFDLVKDAVDTPDGMAIADGQNRRIRLVAASSGVHFGITMTSGNVYTIAGNGQLGAPSPDGTPGPTAQIGSPSSLRADPAGNVVFADQQNGRIALIAASSGVHYGRSMSAGAIYTIVDRTNWASLGTPEGLAIDGAGNVFFSDFNGVQVRAAADGPTLFPVFRSSSPFDIGTMNVSAGTIYRVASGGGSFPDNCGVSYGIENQPALYYGVCFPSALVVDQVGNLLIADRGPNEGSGRIRLLAASTGVAWERSVTFGRTYTLTGGFPTKTMQPGIPATAAFMCAAEGLALDHQGNLLIADTFGGRVNVIAAATGRYYEQDMQAGYLYTIAGDWSASGIGGGNHGTAGDGGPAISAEFMGPYSVFVRSDGSVLIADGMSHRVRRLHPQEQELPRSGPRPGPRPRPSDVDRRVQSQPLHNSGSGEPETR